MAERAAATSRLTARVAAIEILSPRLRRLRLKPDRDPPLAASPGAHLPVSLPERQLGGAYSLIRDPAEDGAYEIVVRRSERTDGMSAALHQLTVGQALDIEPPRNFFPPIAGARRHVMLSAGIGITPFLFYACSFAVQEDWHLVQVCRPAERPAFEELTRALDPARVTFVDGQASFRLQDWLEQPLGSHLYACGPASFLNGIKQDAMAAGWVAGRLHQERFAAPTGRAFTALLARSGHELPVPAGRSLLETLEAAGIAVENLCRGGVCGACRVRVLAGTPEHFDHVLDVDERAGGQTMLACVSRACTPSLTLDL